VTYQVQARDLVTTLFPDAPEFTRKPAVLATGILVALCEWPAMDALRHVIHDHQDSLGTQVHISHRAPVSAGTHLRITVQCTSVTGRASRWDVTACAGTQPVASGWVQFTVVDTAAFLQRHGLPPAAMATANRPTPTTPPTTAQHLPRYATPDHPDRVSVTPPSTTNVTEKCPVTVSA
jgi:fluoroacetyl-CoA thioesterase